MAMTASSGEAGETAAGMETGERHDEPTGAPASALSTAIDEMVYP